MPIAVAIAEDHVGIRNRLVQQLAFFADRVEVVLVSDSGDELLADLVVRDRSGAPMPEVVLMDIAMPGRTGIETTRALTARWPGIDVLMQTVFEDAERIFAAVQAGASGYLLKDAGAEAFVRAIEEVAAGGAPTSPVVARTLLGFVRDQPAADPEAFALTPREREVLGHIVDDRPEAEIARVLHLSPHTVRSHVKNLYSKLQVHSRAQAVRVALQSKLV